VLIRTYWKGAGTFTNIEPSRYTMLVPVAVCVLLAVLAHGWFKYINRRRK
jgi:uncharacterized membrane protein